VQRGKRIALILRILLAIMMLIFALFPVLWIISASFNPTGSLVGQPLIPPIRRWPITKNSSTTRSTPTPAGT
jgi:ABC-type glycerol-3-phosphate transport system permease component